MCVCVSLRGLGRCHAGRAHTSYISIYSTHGIPNKQTNKHTKISSSFSFLLNYIRRIQSGPKKRRRSGVLPPLRDGRTAIKIVAGGRLKEDVSVLYIFTQYTGGQISWSEYRCLFFFFKKTNKHF